MRAAAIAIVAALLCYWAIHHVEVSEQSRSNPPAACQILGGHWSVWSGWQCNG